MGTCLWDRFCSRMGGSSWLQSVPAGQAMLLCASFTAYRAVLDFGTEDRASFMAFVHWDVRDSVAAFGKRIYALLSYCGSFSYSSGGRLVGVHWIEVVHTVASPSSCVACRRGRLTYTATGIGYRAGLFSLGRIRCRIPFVGRVFPLCSLYLYLGTGSLTPSPFIDPRAFALSEAPSSPPPLLLLEIRHPSRLACRGPVHSTREARRARPPVPPRRAERTQVIQRGLWFGEPRDR